MKVTLPYVVVFVVRGEGSKTPKVVLPHEVEILRAQFGDDAILETNDKPHIKECEFDTEDEFARLQETYRGDADNPNPTARVFRSLDEFEAAFKSVASVGVDKAALIEEAKVLGIAANKNWGVEKLQKAIAAAKAE